MNTEVLQASDRLDDLLAEKRRIEFELDSWRRRTSAYFRSIRTLNDIPQAELAAELGISQVYLSQIERDERTPSENILLRMRSLLSEAAL